MTRLRSFVSKPHNLPSLLESKCLRKFSTKVRLETMLECFCAELRKTRSSADKYWRNQVASNRTPNLRLKSMFWLKKRVDATRHFSPDTGRSFTSELLT